jgi:hypothetical protein
MCLMICCDFVFNLNFESPIGSSFHSSGISFPLSVNHSCINRLSFETVHLGKFRQTTYDSFFSFQNRFVGKSNAKIFHRHHRMWAVRIILNILNGIGFFTRTSRCVVNRERRSLHWPLIYNLLFHIVNKYSKNVSLALMETASLLCALQTGKI